MTIYVSPSVPGFLDDEVFGLLEIAGQRNPLCRLPGDAVPISADRVHQLRTELASGKRLGWDGGEPVAVVDTTPLQWSGHQASARGALVQSDAVAMRCMKAGIKYPKAWKDYDANLRAIVSASDGDATAALPQRPAYPEGA